jgi:extracellular matrix protein 14
MLAKSIRSYSAETYTVNSACEGSGFGSKSKVTDNGLSGSAIDWFHAKANVPYSYQLKLRDTGSYGFLLPREMIVPTGREMVELLREFGKWILEKEEGDAWRDELKRKDLK